MEKSGEQWEQPAEQSQEAPTLRGSMRRPGSSFGLHLCTVQHSYPEPGLQESTKEEKQTTKGL